MTDYTVSKVIFRLICPNTTESGSTDVTRAEDGGGTIDTTAVFRSTAVTGQLLSKYRFVVVSQFHQYSSTVCTQYVLCR
jgi:hypothetical protein